MNSKRAISSDHCVQSLQLPNYSVPPCVLWDNWYCDCWPESIGARWRLHFCNCETCNQIAGSNTTKSTLDVQLNPFWLFYLQLPSLPLVFLPFSFASLFLLISLPLFPSLTVWLSFSCLYLLSLSFIFYLFSLILFSVRHNQVFFYLS